MDYLFFPDLKRISSPVSGCALLNPGWTHMTRCLQRDSVLILGRKNRTLIDDEGALLEVVPDRVVILPAGHIHRGYEAIREPVSYYWVHIHHSALPERLDAGRAEGILSQRDLAARRLKNAALLPQAFDPVDRDRIRHLFEEVLAEFTRVDAGDLRYQLLVQLLLVELTREAMRAVRGQAPRPVLLDRMLLAIAEELSNPDLSVKFLSYRLGLNGDYLGRAFKREMELSVGEWIVQRRVALARLRLREGSDRLDTVARQCGFASLRQFHHHFKALEGQSPGAFRRNGGTMSLIGL